MAVFTLLLYPIFAIMILIAWTLATYFQDPKRLRRFPSPSIAAFTQLWSMYHSWKCDQYLAIDTAHAKLGPIIRVAPNHISFSDPDAYKEIYGHGNPGIMKDEFFDRVADGNPSMAQATDKIVHQGKRRALAHVFSAKEITAMEPRVMRKVEALVAALELKCDGGKFGSEDDHEVVDGVFDLRPWLNMLSYEAIGSMFFSHDFGFLARGSDVCSSLDTRGVYKQVHAMDSFHSASRFNTTLAQLSNNLYKLSRRLLWSVHGNKAGSDFFGMSRALVRHRLDNVPSEPDLFSRLPSKPTEKRPVPMPFEEIVAECATMLDAGNDTTQTTLTNCMYLLAKHPEKQERLFRELASILVERGITKSIINSEVLHASPYLRAVLEENWRCRPAVARGLPRCTTMEETIISGKVIHKGTTVSAPFYTILRDEKLFRKASDFVPERWLQDEPFGQDEQEAKNRKEYCVPFSVGPRACIGRNLAYMEVSIVIAALVLNFEWELPRPDYELPVVERFNCNAKELQVRATPRDQYWREPFKRIQTLSLD